MPDAIPAQPLERVGPQNRKAEQVAARSGWIVVHEPRDLEPARRVDRVEERLGVHSGAHADDRHGLPGFGGAEHVAIIGSRPLAGDELRPAPMPSVLWRVPG